ncbi:MAG TPA: polysaccharide pyruvyl transferase family protein, partial [Actinotalea sp.]|nr:polysaccharide pyruvyl transferase family protein [Actinotalea sp.]
MKIVVLGDIGNSTYHAGDELMARAAVDELSRRSELVATAISADAARSRAMYGWPTVARIGFAGMSTESREARLEAIDRAAGGDAGALPWGDPAWDVIHSVADSDAVLITGGGNLNSVWPEHIYERAALARLAAAFARPLVVTGQTVGPHLTARHGELVGEVVTSAVLVGVRELASREICLRLGVPPHKLCANVGPLAGMVAAVRQVYRRHLRAGQRPGRTGSLRPRCRRPASVCPRGLRMAGRPGTAPGQPRGAGTRRRHSGARRNRRGGRAGCGPVAPDAAGPRAG